MEKEVTKDSGSITEMLSSPPKPAPTFSMRKLRTKLADRRKSHDAPQPPSVEMKCSAHPLVNSASMDSRDEEITLPKINARSFKRYAMLAFPYSYRRCGISGQRPDRSCEEKRILPCLPAKLLSPTVLVELDSPAREDRESMFLTEARGSNVASLSGRQAQTKEDAATAKRKRKVAPQITQRRKLHVTSLNPEVVPLNRADAGQISIFEYVRKVEATLVPNSARFKP